MQNYSLNKLRTTATSGELLSDGRVIDLVASTADKKLEIIVYDGKQSLIVPELEHDGLLYVPADPHPSTRRATRFPTCAREYDSAETLLLNISELCTRYCDLSETSASVAAVFVISSWLPEFFSAPPTLCFQGCSLPDAAQLFRLLGTVCRRAITIADLSLQLPLDLHPTLLLVDTGLSKKVRASWRACNYHNVFLPARRGGLQQLACSKLIFCATEDVIGAWGDETLRIPLLPANDVPSLSTAELDCIAAELQPKFLLYRLHRLHTRSDSRAYPPIVTQFALERDLSMLLAGDPGIEKFLLPIAQQQRQAIVIRRSLDPLAAIIEVIWAPAHEQKQISTKEIRERLETLLRARGERIGYSSKEVGWKLSELGLDRQRDAQGMFLRFSRQLCEQIHRLAKRFGLNLCNVDGCEECAYVQVDEQQATV